VEDRVNLAAQGQVPHGVGGVGGWRALLHPHCSNRTERQSI
jgi:hypothetical protein